MVNKYILITIVFCLVEPYAKLFIGFDAKDPSTMLESWPLFHKIPYRHTLHVDNMIQKPSPIIQAACSDPNTGSFKLMTLPECTEDSCRRRFQVAFKMKIILPTTTTTTTTEPTVVLLFKYAYLSVYATLNSEIIERGVIQASFVLTGEAAFCSVEVRLPLEAWFSVLVDYGRTNDLFLVYLNGFSAKHRVSDPCATIDFTVYPDTEEARIGDNGVEVCLDELTYNDGGSSISNPLEYAFFLSYNRTFIMKIFLLSYIFYITNQTGFNEVWYCRKYTKSTHKDYINQIIAF